MKKILSLVLASVLFIAGAVSASAATFTDFESYEEFEKGGNPVYAFDDPADYWDGEWSGGGENGDELTCEIRDGVGYNGSKGLVIASTGTGNAGLYLFATDDNKIPHDYTGSAFLRVWCDFTNVEFRKANFGVTDSTYSLFTTDEVDGAWDCKYYYSADGAAWEEFLHGGDGCFGDAQDTYVNGLKGWFAFPVADFTVRENANWDALDALTPANISDVTGIYLFWDYSDNGDYVEQEFVLDNFEFVADYKVFDTPLAVAEEPAAEEPVVEEPAVEEPAVEEPIVEEPAVEEPVVEEHVVEEPVVVEKAAQTFDMGVTAVISAVVSLAGYTLTKKK